VEEELERLYTFASTYNKIEKRKLEFYKAQETAKTGSTGLRTKLDAVRTRLKPVETKQREISATLTRLKSPPKIDSVQGYLSTEDVSDQLRKQFPQADQAIMAVINSLHKQLASALRKLKDEAVKLVTVKNHVYKVQEQQRAFQKEITALEAQLRSKPEDWDQRGEKLARVDMLRDVGLKAIEQEMDKLGDYQAAFEYASKSPAELEKMIQAREKEMLGVQQTTYFRSGISGQFFSRRANYREGYCARQS
jgi:hypothetical protein